MATILDTLAFYMFSRVNCVISSFNGDDLMIKEQVSALKEILQYAIYHGRTLTCGYIPSIKLILGLI